jgi:hypothetical protein
LIIFHDSQGYSDNLNNMDPVQTNGADSCIYSHPKI